MADSGRIETVHLNNQEDKGEEIVHDDYDQKNEGEEVTLMQNRRPKLLSLEIPMRSLESSVRDFTKINIPSPISAKAGLPPRPASARLKSSVKNLLSQKSFRGKNPSDEAEKSVLMIPDMSSSDKPSTSKSFLNKLLSSAPTKSSNSVPVTPMSNADVSQLQEILVDHQSNELERTDVGRVMMRSLSVPVNVKSRTLRRADSSGVLMRVISIKQPTMVGSSSSEICHETEVVMDDSGEDIPEEEAVCRICFVELGEGGETLKLECSCRGDLALAHKECAVKWFSIKGNKTCEVCKQDVRNLPVTLLKIQNPPNVVRRSSTGQQQREETHYRVWQDVPVLVLISMLAYFCFLEQLLVSDMGTRALAIALPFSCVLGLLSSMIASTMVDKRYIWAYASFQFAIVILFAHIFYTVLNVNAILSVLLSSFTGFGIVISTNSLVAEYLRWRCSRYPQSNHTRHEARQHRHNQNQRNQTNDNQQALNVARTRNEQQEATVQRLSSEEGPL